MNKTIPGLFAAGLLVFGAQPAPADVEAFVTGGGIIREGRGQSALKITFGLNVYVGADEQAAGHLQINFHNVGTNDDVDKTRFRSFEFDELFIEPRTFAFAPLEEYLYIRIRATGYLNRDPDWAVTIRFADYGGPGRAKPGSGALGDAVRIQLYDPFGTPVYDTALDFPKEQSWRTMLDGGNVRVHFEVNE